MNKALKIMKFVVLGVVGMALLTYGTMWLWNWLIPDLFNGPYLTFWQTLGLFVLSKIFFGFPSGKKHQGPGGYWKYRMIERFSNMTPEQREALKQRMKDKWCAPKGSGAGKDSSPLAD
jgi:hypothetical protein